MFVSLITDTAAGGDAEGDELNSIENLTGSAYDDDLWGNDGANVLNGDGGNDTLKGFGGADTLYGGERQRHAARAWTATTRCGGTATTRSWRRRPRHLYGGSGADVFRWDATDETGLTAATADVIYGLQPPRRATEFDLSGIDADVYAAGNQAFTFIGTAAFSGTPGEINYFHSGGNTYIQMQTGTSADVEGVIRLAGIVTPEASWFVL